MNDCIFCKIIKGEIPAYTIYEDDKVKAFLDVNPASNGHILLIPKKHYKTFLETPNDLITDMYKVIKETIYPLLKERLNITGLSVCQIGKDVPHHHMHLIPQYKNDKVELTFDKTELEDIDKIFEKLK